MFYIPILSQPSSKKIRSVPFTSTIDQEQKTLISKPEIKAQEDYREMRKNYFLERSLFI